MTDVQNESGPTDPTRSNDDVAQVVERRVELNFRFARRSTTDLSSGDRRFEHDSIVRQVEHSGSLRRAVRAIPWGRDHVGAPQHALPANEQHRVRERSRI